MSNHAIESLAAFVDHYQSTFPPDYEPAFLPDYEGALAYEAPYLIERLIREAVVFSEEEGQALFRELKRYFVLSSIDESRVFEMDSYRIEEVWDVFLDFAASYAKYCREFFGVHITHAPSNAPIATFEEFASFYQRVFKEPLPDVWYDATGLASGRRVH